MSGTTYNTAEAARLIGVSKSTLLHWFRTNVIQDVSRSSKGWRVFTEDDVERLRAFRRSESSRVRAADVAAPGAERRRWLRVRAKLPVRYEFPLKGSMGPITGHSETINMGPGGVMLGVDPEWIRLSEIRLAITVPGASASVEALGEVRWVQRWDGRNLLGVKFIGIGPADKRVIGEYLARGKA